MKKALLIIAILFGMQLACENLIKADDIGPSEFITGFLKKERDPERPLYPHMPSKSPYYFTCNGVEIVVYCEYESMVEVRLTDAKTGEMIADDIADLLNGHVIDIANSHCDSYKLTVIADNGVYSATF